MKHAIFVLAVILFGLSAARADPPGDVAAGANPNQRAAAIEQASWLAGRWVGEGLGGQLEETWSPPAGGQMIGHFRLIQDGAVVFYELCLLDEANGGLRMRVKHVNPDFVGWEERDAWHAFEPVSASAEALAFDGLSFRRVGQDQLEIVLSITSANGERQEVLRLRRAPL